MRWLSTTTSTELVDRLSAITSCSSENVSSKVERPATSFSMEDQEPTGNIAEDIQCSIGSETCSLAPPTENASPSTRLPLVPSFSEFINSKKVKDNPNSVQKDLEKRMRFQ